MILYPTSKMIDVFFYSNSRLLQFSFFVLVGFVSAFVLFVRVCCVAYNATDPKILNLATYEGAYRGLYWGKISLEAEQANRGPTEIPRAYRAQFCLFS